jgi:hypothetical protein
MRKALPWAKTPYSLGDWPSLAPIVFPMHCPTGGPARGLHHPNRHPPSSWRQSWVWARARDATEEISPISNLQRKQPRILTENHVELESAPITSIRIKTPIKGIDPIRFFSSLRAQTLGTTPCHRHTATRIPEPSQLPQEPRRRTTPPLVTSSLPEEHQSPPTWMPSLARTTSPSPATIVARRRRKVSKIGFPHHLDVVGENLIENRGWRAVYDQLHWATTVGRPCCRLEHRPLVRVTLSHPLAHQRSRLEAPYHFAWSNLSRRSWFQWLTFNELHRPVDRILWTRFTDP